MRSITITVALALIVLAQPVLAGKQMLVPEIKDGPQLLVRSPKGACWIAKMGSKWAEFLIERKKFEVIGEYPSTKDAKKAWREKGCREPY